MSRSSIGSVGRAAMPSGVYQFCCRAYDRVVASFFLIGSLGGNRECPFCEFRWRRFRPDDGEPSELFTNERIIGGGPIENAVCPWCGSFERERQIFLYLREQTDILADRVSVMHMAPEWRIQKWLTAKMKGKYTSVDLQSPLADVHADICNLPFPEDSFDLVICNHVLEHIPDDRQAMRELRRVLKAGGKAILQVPIAGERQQTDEDSSLDAEARLLRFGQRDHVRLYGLDYAERLTGEGFVVEQIDPRTYLGEEGIHRYALIDDELIYVACKTIATDV